MHLGWQKNSGSMNKKALQLCRSPAKSLFCFTKITKNYTSKLLEQNVYTLGSI